MPAGEDVLLPDDEEAGAAVVAGAEGVEGAPDDPVCAVVVDVGEGFEASPEGGFILSE
ncbi:hypothetical protein ACO9S2_14760 [Nitrospira sp. NS4]|uniref:hypothetical protein n=1 Tax=Nitrospira sp. NS4 TaxID=3414498 RepID=UPI003C2F256D